MIGIVFGFATWPVNTSFARQGGGSPVSTLILPAIAGLIMAAFCVCIFINYGDLTGTTGGALSWMLPSLIPVGGVTGFLLAHRLRASTPLTSPGSG